jgi:hypothetical protein
MTAVIAVSTPGRANQVPARLAGATATAVAATVASRLLRMVKKPR